MSKTQLKKTFVISGVLALLLAGFLLRLHHLGLQSFWMDEYIDYYTGRMGFLSMLAGVRVHRGGLPIHYFIEYLMLKFGQSEFWLRLPAALFSTAAIGVSFAWARTIFPNKKEISWMFAAMMAFSIFQIRYAQEARFYGLFVFLNITLWWLFSCALQKQRKFDWIVYFSVVAISSYTHYYTFITLACQAVIAFHCDWLTGNTGQGTDLKKRYPNFINMIKIGIAAGLCFIPAALFYLTKEGEYASFHWHWGLLEPTTRLMAGGLSAWLILLIAGNVFLESSQERRWSVWIGAGLLAAAAVVLGLDKWRGYFFHNRQLIFIQPLVLLLMAAGLAAILRKILAWVVHENAKLEKAVIVIGLGITLCLNLPLVWAYKTETKYNSQRFVVDNINPDWRHAVAYLKNNAGDCPLYLCINHIVKKGLEYQWRLQSGKCISVAQVNEDMTLLDMMLQSNVYDEYWLVDGDIFEGGYFARLTPEKQAWLRARLEPSVDFYKMRLWKFKAVLRVIAPKELAVPFGNPEARMFLGDGWWEDDDQGERHDAIWSSGDASSLIIPVRSISPKTLVAKIYPVKPQTMQIYINGQKLGQYEIRAGWNEYQFSLAGNAWQKGNNRIEFRYSQSQRYHKFARTRAMQWALARFEY